VEELLTYAQASKMLNMKLGTLYALVAQNRIPHVRLGRRLVRFRQTELDTWLSRHSVEPKPSADERSRSGKP
jgi:excisionase family DNA binding protein